MRSEEWGALRATRVESGEWKVELRVASLHECGMWKVESGEWKVELRVASLHECGMWKVESGIKGRIRSKSGVWRVE